MPTIPDMLFDPTMQGLSQALTLRQKRHEVIASNLANVETPGYRAKELDFGAALQQAFEIHRAPEVPESEPPLPAERVVEDLDAPARADGNTVDVDMQMAKLSANGEDYVALSRLLGHRLALLRQAITGV